MRPAPSPDLWRGVGLYTIAVAPPLAALAFAFGHPVAGAGLVLMSSLSLACILTEILGEP